MMVKKLKAEEVRRSLFPHRFRRYGKPSPYLRPVRKNGTQSFSIQKSPIQTTH
jgi:hypothetical protein